MRMQEAHASFQINMTVIIEKDKNMDLMPVIFVISVVFTIFLPRE